MEMRAILSAYFFNLLQTASSPFTIAMTISLQQAADSTAARRGITGFYRYD